MEFGKISIGRSYVIWLTQGGLHFVWSLGNCGSSPHFRCGRDHTFTPPFEWDTQYNVRSITQISPETLHTVTRLGSRIRSAKFSRSAWHIPYRVQRTRIDIVSVVVPALVKPVCISKANRVPPISTVAHPAVATSTGAPAVPTLIIGVCTKGVGITHCFGRAYGASASFTSHDGRQRVCDETRVQKARMKDRNATRSWFHFYF